MGGFETHIFGGGGGGLELGSVFVLGGRWRGGFLRGGVFFGGWMSGVGESGGGGGGGGDCQGGLILWEGGGRMGMVSVVCMDFWTWWGGW